MSSDEEYASRSASPSGLRRRIANFLTRGPSAPAKSPVSSDDSSRASTIAGYSEVEAQMISAFLGGVSTERSQVYEEVDEMETTIDEVSVGLSILSQAATTAPRGDLKAFRLEWSDRVPEAQRLLAEQAIHRCMLYDKMPYLALEMLLYGDLFVQPVITKDMVVSRLMYMPPDTMVRNEASDGLLLNGTEEGEWAFEQYVDNQFVAGFYPWQIIHVRWDRRGGSRYGRSIMFSARRSWRRLRAMEEAMTYNWLTRAYARLLFMIDVTGLSEEEAQKKIRKFRKNLSVMTYEVGNSRRENLTIAKDIYMGTSYHDMGGELTKGLTDVKVLDTAPGVGTLDPVEYYRNKIIMSTRVPKAYFGVEEDINAKATLTREDVRFADSARQVQNHCTQIIKGVVSLTLLLNNYMLEDGDLYCVWQDPMAQDALEVAQARRYQSQADQIYYDMRVVDRQWMAEKSLGMSTSEWEELDGRSGEDEDGRDESPADDGGGSEEPEDSGNNGRQSVHPALRGESVPRMSVSERRLLLQER